MCPPITNVYLQLVELTENYIISGFYGKITRCGSTSVHRAIEGKDPYIIVAVKGFNIRNKKKRLLIMICLIHVWKLSRSVLLL